MRVALQTRVDELRASIDNLVRVMGRRFLLFICLVSHVTKGFLCGGGQEGLIGTPLQFMMRSYGTLSASRIQVLRTIAVSAWALKPLFGMLSDVVPLAGYHKRPYIAAATLLSMVACLALALLSPLSPSAVTILVFVVFAQVAVTDLLTEAKYAQKLYGGESAGPDLATFIHTGSSLAQLASIFVCGLLISYVPLHYLYLAPLPVLALTLWPIYQGGEWLDDTEYSSASNGGALSRTAIEYRTLDASGAEVESPPVADDRLCNLCGPLLWYYRSERDARRVPVVGLDTQKVRTNWRLFALGCIIVACSLVTSCIGLAGLSTAWLFGISMACVVVLIAALFLLMEDKRIAMIQTYSILCEVCNLSTGSAEFFFFTDTPAQYPEGPHFSAFFYVTVMGGVGTLLYFVGSITYYLFMRKWRFRSVLYFSGALQFVLSWLTIIMVKRWNIAVGLPDWLFVLGSEALQTVTASWASMPISLMILQLCVPGIEATCYALLAGSINMGRALSRYSGAFALDMFGVNPIGAVGESAQFENFWKVVVISIFMSLIPLALVPFFIPDGKQTDRLLKEEAEATDDDDEAVINKEEIC